MPVAMPVKTFSASQGNQTPKSFDIVNSGSGRVVCQINITQTSFANYYKFDGAGNNLVPR